MLPTVGKGNPVQYPCLENPMDREVWWATVHGVAESGTTEHAHALVHYDLILITSTKTLSLKEVTFIGIRVQK